MELLANEKTILTSNNNRVVLTDHRIIVNDERLGQAYGITIFLEDISSIENSSKSKLIYLILAGIMIFYGIILYAGIHSELAKYGFYVGLFFLFFWFLTRNQLIVISSNGGSSADILASYVSKQGVKEFIYQVVKAKAERIQMLNHS